MRIAEENRPRERASHLWPRWAILSRPIILNTYDNRPSETMKRMSVLMAVAFVDMIGLMLVLPLLPLDALHLHADATTIGFLTAAFAVAQLVDSPESGGGSRRARGGPA